MRRAIATAVAALLVTGLVVTCTFAADHSSRWMLLPGIGGDTSVISGTSASPETVNPGSKAVFDELTAGLGASSTAMVLAFG